MRRQSKSFVTQTLAKRPHTKVSRRGEAVLRLRQRIQGVNGVVMRNKPDQSRDAWKHQKSSADPPDIDGQRIQEQGMSAVIDIVKDIAERVQRNKWVVTRTGLYFYDVAVFETQDSPPFCVLACSLKKPPA